MGVIMVYKPTYIWGAPSGRLFSESETHVENASAKVVDVSLEESLGIYLGLKTLVYQLHCGALKR